MPKLEVPPAACAPPTVPPNSSKRKCDVSAIPPRPSLAIPPFNEVTRHNLSAMHLGIKHIIDRAHHISLDTEFTGLGSNRETRASNIEDRYKALAQVARSHALVAFGMTVFELTQPSEMVPMSDSAENTDSHEGLGDGKETRFLVHNFTFLMLREDDYVVSPKSMAFLVDNGFDFNKQFQDGILYKPGNDEEIANPVKAALDSNHIMRSIFHHVLERNVPVCLHNGLLDLLFLYQSFYAELPAQLGSFNADLTEMFPGGLYDTKYIAEFVTREKASFLAYLFRKYERDHLERNLTKRKDYLCFEIQQRLPSIEKKDTPLPSVNPKRPALDTGKPYCEQYAAHGYCNEGRHCHRTHDLDLILDEVDVESTAGKATRRRKRQKMMEAKKALESDGTSQSDSVSGMQAAAGDDKEERKTNLVEMSTAVSTASVAPALPPSSPAIISGPDPKTMSADASLFEKYHSACFDAYMTGFIFAHQCLEYPSHREEHRNRMYLMGKQIPLLLSGSNFSKTSKNHQQKRSRLKPAYLVNVKEEAGK